MFTISYSCSGQSHFVCKNGTLFIDSKHLGCNHKDSWEFPLALVYRKQTLVLASVKYKKKNLFKIFIYTIKASLLCAIYL